MSYLATFDAQDRIETFNSWDFLFDDDGNVLSRSRPSPLETIDYTFDEFGHLVQVSYPGGVTESYRYDGLQRKAAVYQNSVLKYGYLYLDQIRLLAEMDDTFSFRSIFVWGERPQVPEYMVRGGTTYRLVTDPRGSVRLVINAADGSVVSRIDYDEYGRQISGTAIDFQPFRFAGGRTAFEDGLIQFGVRHYDPEIGRWISKDPILFDGGDTNLYGYVLNDPVNLVDPTGNCPQCVAAGLGAVLGGVIGGAGAAYSAPVGCRPLAFLGGAIGGALGGAAIGISGGASTFIGTIGAIGIDFGATAAGYFAGFDCKPRPPKENSCQK